MRRVELNHGMTIKMSESQRRAIEGLANRQEVTLGAAARYVLMAGFKALGIASMGPRLFSRGNFDAPASCRIPNSASMGPRLFSRGNALLLSTPVQIS